ncbi:putative ABC bile acid transporter, partial [Tothia fuscella]
MALPLFLSLHIGIAALVFCLTIGAFIYNFTEAKPSKTELGLYQDKDGKATPETQKAYSTRWQNIFATVLAVLGFGVALANAVIVTVKDAETSEVDGWVQFGLWVFIIIQRIQTLYTRADPVRTFNLALFEALSNLSVAVLLILTVYFMSNGHSHNYLSMDRIFVSINAIVSTAGFLTCINFPRRPQLIYDGRPIDAGLSVSAFMRYTWSWPSGLLALSAKTGKDMEYTDMPLMDSFTRSTDLYEVFKLQKENTSGGILSVLLNCHWRSMLVQNLLSGLDALMMVAPQFAMYHLLRLLEARDSGTDITLPALFWVITLALLIAVGGFVNNWMWWLCYGSMNIPVRMQLASAIFAKSMRRKDIKGTVGSKDSEESAEAVMTLDAEEADHAQPHAQPEKENEPTAEDVEETINKSRQGVINLIGVDAKRVSDFSTVNNMFFGATCRLVFSFIFLGKLVGWQPLCAGMAVQISTLPLNIFYSKKYTNGQKTLMEQRDKKLAVINEALGGIRQIKFAALERQWQKRIMDVRNDELGALWRCLMYDVVLLGLWLAGPVLLSAATIGLFAWLNGGLPPSVAFTTISILSQIEGTLAWLPELTTNMLDAYVSLKRIGEYLDGPEKVPVTVDGENITFKDVSVAWPSDNEKDDMFALRNVNLAFPTGELSVISGKTGSGKSLLLAALLGEVEVLSGTITLPRALTVAERRDDKANKGNWIIPNAVAFVSQIPWIENCSLKNNIVFGLPLEEQRYKKVITACALDKDLEILTDGDATEIGANGINLSGGQRWRVTLGRALYSRAGVLVLDDIFSAVDAHVGKHIFEEALTGDLCKGRTRILVTHHVSLTLPKTKYEVRLGEGTVGYAGIVDEKERAGALEAIADEEEEDALDDTAEARLNRISSAQSQKARRTSTISQSNGSALRKTRTLSRSPKKFVEEENKETGWIKFSVYRAYLDACGGFPFWMVVAITFGGYEALLLGRSWVLRLWTEHYENESMMLKSWYNDSSIFVTHSQASFQPRTEADRNQDLKFYLALYLGFAVAICVEGTLRYLWVFYGSIKASRVMFERLTHAVLRAPLRWLDTMPVGRVLNRFTADFNQTDSGQAYNMAFCLYNLMIVVGIVVAGSIVSPYIILCAVILLGICSNYAFYYLATARQTKRLESTAKSPVFELFSAALAGVSTLRAFDKTDTYITTMFQRLDTHAATLWYQWLLNRWLSWRLNVIGAVFSFIVALLIVNLKMDAALGGFALGFTLQYTEGVTWLLRNFAGVEMSMNSVERIIEYSEIITETEGGADAPAAWPTDGRLEVEDLVVGYAPDLPPVLKGLTFSVERNERIGVVGRTGAGKSSLTLALFRFLEAREGSVYIDGVDISKIKLHDLRSRIAIIPQDPVLFSGTVRSNLDPFDEHDDQALKDALERVHLVECSNSSIIKAKGKATTANTNTNVFKSLRSPISEGGLNLSQGQRQLLCLARAIVARPKIMILDEATSAVDKATDALIQRSIREEFQDSTLIVIAHRLSTIVDFDRILVMSEGKVAEYDSPKTLIEKEDGILTGMIESSGESEVLKDII